MVTPLVPVVCAAGSCALAGEGENPLDLLEQNISSTLSLIEALKEIQGSHLVLVAPHEKTRKMLERIGELESLIFECSTIGVSK